MIANLGKYSRNLTVTAQYFLAYRFSVFCSITVGVTITIAQIIFWKAVYRAGEGDVAGFSLGNMVMYLIVSSFVSGFIWVLPPHNVREDIITGELKSHLLVPASYLLTSFFMNTGYKVSNWISMLVLLTLMAVFFQDVLKFVEELWVYPCGLLAISLAYLLNFHFCFCLGLYNGLGFLDR